MTKTTYFVLYLYYLTTNWSIALVDYIASLGLLYFLGAYTYFAWMIRPVHFHLQVNCLYQACINVSTLTNRRNLTNWRQCNLCMEKPICLYLCSAIERWCRGHASACILKWHIKLRVIACVLMCESLCTPFVSLSLSVCVDRHKCSSRVFVRYCVCIILTKCYRMVGGGVGLSCRTGARINIDSMDDVFSSAYIFVRLRWICVPERSRMIHTIKCTIKHTSESQQSESQYSRVQCVSVRPVLLCYRRCSHVLAAGCRQRNIVHHGHTQEHTHRGPRVWYVWGCFCCNAEQNIPVLSVLFALCAPQCKRARSKQTDQQQQRKKHSPLSPSR